MQSLEPTAAARRAAGARPARRPCYLTTLFAIVAYVLDLPIQRLLATSVVIAIILGLALQSTLGDVFSGIVLSFSRAYRAGEWVGGW